MTMTTKILIWMVAGLVLGSLTNAFASDVAFVQDYFVNGLFHVVGAMFITGLKMLVVPLVTFSLICGRPRRALSSCATTPIWARERR